jgi:hypothetical protein
MSQTNWISLGYPISKDGETHVFVEDGGDIVQRCDTSVTATEGDVVNVSEDELTQMLRKEDHNFCGECIRYMSQVAP